MRRLPWDVVAVGVLVAAVAVVGWAGLVSLGPAAGPDAAEHIRYAEFYDRTDRLPPAAENYEYASPPGYALAGVYAQRAARAIGAPEEPLFASTPSALRRLLWLALVAIAGALLASPSASGRVRWGAVGALGVALAWAVVSALSLARSVEWSSGQLISLASACGLVLVAWGLGRLAFPGRRLAPLLVALATAGLPVVLRQGVVFHPEMLFAVLAALAVLVFAHAAGRSWPWRHAVAVGALVGLAAVTRQTAAIVAPVLGVAAVVLGRRAAARFLVVGAVSLLLVAGPWWGYQTSRFGNPIQSNLDRAGYMLEGGQPRSFFVSFPLHDLVVHPYRPSFPNQLLPKFHADLWSDWYGVDRNYWSGPSGADRLLASTQSVLGFGGDLLALGGLVLLAIPALVRAARRRARDGRDALLATLALLALATWAAFVLTLVRHPQAEGDPIKANYMLFLAPAFALFGVALAERLWRRGRAWQAALAAWALLYVLSYAGVLVTTY
jgi:4-amino-4-deoxy-L-arabinose transferase-like glycosyltransferase